MTPQRFLFFPAFVWLLAVFGCVSAKTTPIAEILANSMVMDGKKAMISGKVTGSTNLYQIRYFVVKDNSGEIVVVTEKAVSTVGQELTVSGIVHQAFVIGEKQLVVLKETP